MSPIKLSTRQTILSKELRNPDYPFLMEIRMSKVKPCRALSKNKKYFCLFLSSFLSHIFWENKHFKNYTDFIYIIKGIVLGRALWGANTFPTRNPLPDPKFDFHGLALSFSDFSIVFHINYDGDSSILKIIILFCSPSPS